MTLANKSANFCRHPPAPTEGEGRQNGGGEGALVGRDLPL